MYFSSSSNGCMWVGFAHADASSAAPLTEITPYCPKTHHTVVLARFAPPQQTGAPASRG